MVSIALFSKRHELGEFLTLQFVTAACIMLVGAIIAEPFPTNIGMEHLPSLLYLIFACTLTAMFLQNWGQRHTNPSRAAIIMSLEAVFGVVFSMIFYHEEVSAMTAWGFVAIFVSVIISETGDKWRLPIKKPSAVTTERTDKE
jgi:drug/metabolite transporter (DMT)-like permease